MATPSFLLNRYQRTLGNKPRLLQRRIAIEKDIEDKKYAADIDLMNQKIKIGGAAVGTGVDYMLAKKGGYTEGFKAFLEERMKEKQGGNTTYSMNKDGTMSPSSRGGVVDPTKSYRTFMEAGRKQVGEDIKKGWENIKGLMPTKDSFSKMFEKSSGVKTPTLLHNLVTGGTDTDKYNPQPTLQGGESLISKGEQHANIQRKNAEKFLAQYEEGEKERYNQLLYPDNSPSDLAPQYATTMHEADMYASSGRLTPTVTESESAPNYKYINEKPVMITPQKYRVAPKPTPLSSPPIYGDAKSQSLGYNEALNWWKR
jgi:hypothetical protein